MARTYATVDDLAEWVTPDDPPANAAKLLRAASGMVEDAVTVAYVTNPTTGLPTDAVVAEAMRDATCAQATTWAAQGVDPALGDAQRPRVVQASSVGAGSVTYAAADATAAAVLVSARALGFEARGILTRNGLIGQPAILA